MGSVGDSYDNALMENFWSTLKIELVYRTSWRTRDEAENAIFTYIDTGTTPAASNANSATSAPTNTRQPGTPKPRQITSPLPRPEAGNHRSVEPGGTQFDEVLGFDPVAEMQNWFTGDWEPLAQMQEVLTNASNALHDNATNVQSGATNLNDFWQGYAGAAAYVYFSDTAAAIDGLRGPLQQIGEAYKTMADAVWSVGEAISGTLKGMIDSAIIAGVAAAAGTATAETGIGASVGYGLAGLEAVNILTLWGNATVLWTKANTTVLAFRTAVNKYASDLDGVQLPVIGGGAGYDHPVVGAGAHA